MKVRTDRSKAGNRAENSKSFHTTHTYVNICHSLQFIDLFSSDLIVLSSQVSSHAPLERQR